MPSLAYARQLHDRPTVDPGYWTRLLLFIADHGWQLHSNQDRRFCGTFGYLDNAGHHCSGRACHAPMPVRERGYNLDHTLLLRRGVGHYPLQWALLSQPYSRHDDSGQAVHLGPAPYGYGTVALLYAGTARAVTR